MSSNRLKSNKTGFGQVVIFIIILLVVVYIIENFWVHILVAAGILLSILFWYLFIHKDKSERDNTASALSEIVRSSYLNYKNNLKIITRDSYVEKFNSINNRLMSNDKISLEERLKLSGDKGELMVLQLIESLGKSITYWSVGLNYKGTKCEFDILSLTPFGVLHVEVKNYSGEYFSMPGESVLRPNDWGKKIGDTVVQSISPFRQADRARRTLKKALQDSCECRIPVTSVIVFTNPEFIMKNIVDDRVAYCDFLTFGHYYNDFINGNFPHSQKIEPYQIANLVSCLQHSGQFPVFFDDSIMPIGENDYDLIEAT